MLSCSKLQHVCDCVDVFVQINVYGCFFNYRHFLCDNNRFLITTNFDLLVILKQWFSTLGKESLISNSAVIVSDCAKCVTVSFNCVYLKYLDCWLRNLNAPVIHVASRGKKKILRKQKVSFKVIIFFFARLKSAHR